MSGAERGDLFRESRSPRRARSRSTQSRERRAGRVEEPRDLVVGELPRQLHRREARAVQDLVGVGVADAAEEARIGQRALERVVLARAARRGSRRDRRRTPRARRGRARRARPRRAPGGATARRFVPASVSIRVPVEKSNAASPILPGSFAPALLPVQPPGDHQVDHERTGRPRARTRCACRGGAARSRARPATLGERRVDRAQHERVGEAHALERAPRRCARRGASR